MKFLIQKIDNEIRHDFSFHLLQALHFRKWIDPKSKNTVRYLNYDPTKIAGYGDYQDVLETLAIPFKESHKQFVPIGSVEFVTKYLQHFYGLTPIPLNIPSELSDYEYTRRGVWTFSLGALSSLKKGRYFVKSATKIKGFAEVIEKTDENWNFPDDMYQVSEYINIESEWRAFVYEGKLVGLQNYCGEFTLFPNPEIIKNMIKAYKSAPVAYTLDVGVCRDYGLSTLGNSVKHTFVIEVHDFFSCGLYGFADYGKLPYMFTRWFAEYLKNK